MLLFNRRDEHLVRLSEYDLQLLFGYCCSFVGLIHCLEGVSGEAIKLPRVSVCVISCFACDSLKLQEVQSMTQWSVIYSCLRLLTISFELIKFTSSLLDWLVWSFKGEVLFFKPSCWDIFWRTQKIVCFCLYMKVCAVQNNIALCCLSSNGQINAFFFHSSSTEDRMS